MKVKELIEKLSTMPPDAELVSYQSDLEKSGIKPVNYTPTLKNLFFAKNRYIVKNQYTIAHLYETEIFPNAP